MDLIGNTAWTYSITALAAPTLWSICFPCVNPALLCRLQPLTVLRCGAASITPQVPSKTTQLPSAGCWLLNLFLKPPAPAAAIFPPLLPCGSPSQKRSGDLNLKAFVTLGATWSSGVLATGSITVVTTQF